MYLVYLDEVKFDPKNEPYHWLCGLAIPKDDVLDIENSLNLISNKYFGSPLLDVSTEFHATKIVQGKGPFCGWEIQKRLSLMKRLADVISMHPNLGRIVVRLTPACMKPKDCPEVAFMYMVERVNQFMRAKNSLALLIADLDQQFASANVRNLSKYKNLGTEFAFGQEINHVVDTVHQTCSHHSRLLQLVDIYAYSVALSHKSDLTYLRGAYINHVRDLDNFLFPTKYKFWPQAYTRR